MPKNDYDFEADRRPIILQNHSENYAMSHAYCILQAFSLKIKQTTIQTMEKNINKRLRIMPKVK
jgi:hypothetical protein